MIIDEHKKGGIWLKRAFCKNKDPLCGFQYSFTTPTMADLGTHVFRGVFTITEVGV